jgi:hypothetical protein
VNAALAHDPESGLVLGDLRVANDLAVTEEENVGLGENPGQAARRDFIERSCRGDAIEFPGQQRPAGFADAP